MDAKHAISLLHIAPVPLHLCCITEDAGQHSPVIHVPPLADITNGTHPASPTVLITPRRPNPLPSHEAIEPGHGGNEDDSADDTNSGE